MFVRGSANGNRVVCMCGVDIYVCTYIYAYMYIYKYIYAHGNRVVCMCGVDIWVCTYVYAYMYIYIYICIYIYMYIYVHSAQMGAANSENVPACEAAYIQYSVEKMHRSCLSCKPISAKERLIICFFGRKWPILIRNRVGARLHTILMFLYVHENVYIKDTKTCSRFD